MTVAKVKHKDVWSALAAAQANFGPIKKTEKGYHAGSTYAPLEAVLDEIRPHLNAEGVAISSVTAYSPPSRATNTATGEVTETEGHTSVITQLCHGESDTRIVSKMPLQIVADEQKVAKQITYWRRYQAAGIAGVQPESEDKDQPIEAASSGKGNGGIRTLGNGDGAATASDEFAFPPGSQRPEAPSWAKWREDTCTRQGEMQSVTWGEVCKADIGSKEYAWCRSMFSKGDLSANFAAKLHSALFEIESRAWGGDPEPEQGNPFEGADDLVPHEEIGF